MALQVQDFSLAEAFKVTNSCPERTAFVVKALHGQSEQYLARSVNTNRPSPLQFAQGAADTEVLLVAKQGRVYRRVRGAHLRGLLLLGAFVEHRKS